MANFFVTGTPATRSPYKNTPSSSLPLHGLYTFGNIRILLKGSCAVVPIRMGSPATAHPAPRISSIYGGPIKNSTKVGAAQ